MMFRWANKQLEKLSETLAPPPSTPAHRYLAALASHQEDVALAILNDQHEPLDPYFPLNQKGMNALHAAAAHGIVSIIRQLVGRGVRVDFADYNGWTALHHASASKTMSAQTALATVKVLVEELGASVVTKDATAQTPYDVGSSQAVRGYLLPRQLQQETQECLNNGGAGLMPGIDMGGLTVNYNVAPPPVMGTPGPPPPPSMNSNNYDPSAALMQPPPVRGINSTFSPQPVANNSNATNFSPPGMMHQAIPSSIPNDTTGFQSFVPPSNYSGDDRQQDQATSFPERPPIQTPNQQQQQTSHSLANRLNAEQPPKSKNSTASASFGYALRGGDSNSAFVLNESRYKPDGFHTSSNDKELQAKYGHVENSFETSRKSAIPPPPISGGSPAIGGANSTASHPSPHSGGANPFSAMGTGNVRTMGYIGGTGRARYPTYCAVSDSVSAPPSLGGAGYSTRVMPPAPSYSTFVNPAVQPIQVVAPAGQTQQWSGEQYMQNSSSYLTEQNNQVAASGQTQHWSGEHQMQNYANVDPHYVVQSQQTYCYDQQPTSGYACQHHQQQPPHTQPQVITNTDLIATTSKGDAASMFATPHAEKKKDFFPSSSENNDGPNTVDVFSPPPSADSNATGLLQNQAKAASSAPHNETFASNFEVPAENASHDFDASRVVSTTEPSPSLPDSNHVVRMANPGTLEASSFFGAPENNALTKTFGGIPPPPVVWSNNPDNLFSAPATTLGVTSSLPPPPMTRRFPNQTPNPSAPSAEIPTEQFADVSL